MKANVSQLAATLNERFENMLLDLDTAIVMAGKKTDAMKMLEDSEQGNRRRELLLMEEVAQKRREVEAKETQSMLAEVEAEFHLSLIADLREQFQNPEYVFTEIMEFHPAMGRLLDVLYTEACSISMLEECVEQIPWLKKALIRFVKQPKYERLDSDGNPLVIESARGALSFVGIESLRLLLPALIAKKSLPPNSEYLPQLLEHLWEYTLGSGKATQVLAEKEGLKWFFGYNLGLMSTLGRSAIARMYLKAFDDKVIEKVTEARNLNNPTQAQLLTELKPSATYLISFWQRYANRLSLDLIELMKFKRLAIQVGIEDYVRIKEVSIKAVDKANLHPLTRVLFQSQGYMQFKMMKNHGLLSKQASMLYLRNFGIRSEDVVQLSKVNLTSLEVKIAES